MAIQTVDGERRFQTLRPLKSGSFGSVVLAQDVSSDNRPVAIKYIPRANVNAYVETELVTQRQLVHPHIIGLKAVFCNETHLGIALEYADGGDMYEYVMRKRRLQESEARWFFQQLIIALDYCHRKGVVNRDIKLENTLISWNARGRAMLRLCDFGYAKDQKVQSDCSSRVGTPQYLAPEVLTCKSGGTYDGEAVASRQSVIRCVRVERGQKVKRGVFWRRSKVGGFHNLRYFSQPAKASDIWSCGVMLYVMLVGAYPFEKRGDKARPPAESFSAMMDRIVRCDYTIPSSIELSDGGRDLLQHILVADPQQRYSISDIVRHPWFLERLPTTALAMNDRFLSMQPTSCAQSEEDIRRIVREARQVAGRRPTAWLQSLAAESADEEDTASSKCSHDNTQPQQDDEQQPQQQRHQEQDEETRHEQRRRRPRRQLSREEEQHKQSEATSGEGAHSQT